MILEDRIKHIKGSLICPFLFLLFLSACSSEPSWHQIKGEALGTGYSVQYKSHEKPVSRAELDSLFNWFNHALSTYQEDSYISAWNRRDSNWLAANQSSKYYASDTALMSQMIRTSLLWYQWSGGAFDPSAGLLFNLWSQAKQQQVKLSDSNVSYAIGHKGFDSSTIDDWSLAYQADSPASYNFNAIAKGFAVDVLAAFLESKGATSYMAEIGGELVVKGKNPEGEVWKLGVNQPEIGSDLQSIFEVIKLDSGAMATSGNYRNYYIANGDTLGHTIDPRTGWPVNNKLKSATVLFPNCAEADALATACMVLGLEQAEEFIKSVPSAQAFLIYEERGELIGKWVRQ